MAEGLPLPLETITTTPKKLVRDLNLHTVCESAACPNVGEIAGTARTATFMILGNVCTRRHAAGRAVQKGALASGRL